MNTVCLDVDVKDVYGQTLLHEVAREWSPGVAHFLCIKGLDINSEDDWGRTPLFVAVASNYPEMITWMLNNGGNAGFDFIYIYIYILWLYVSFVDSRKNLKDGY